MLKHLYEILVSRATRYPNAVALGSQEQGEWRTLDSVELLDRVGLLAAELSTRGVREGDRVVLWLPNSWRTPVYMFALWKLGAIVVPFDREMNAEGAAKILESVEPRLVLAGYGESPGWAAGYETTEWWLPERRAATPSAEGWQPPREELAALFFTSGTTGQPKGCMITHSNLCSQVEVFEENIPLDPSCRLAGVLPLSHLFEFTCGLLYPLAMGAAIHYVPSRKGTDILRVLQEQRITHMMAVPQLLTLMGNALEERLRSQLPSWLYRPLCLLADRLPLAGRRRLFKAVHQRLGGHLSMMVSGGAALPPSTRHLWERLGIRLVEGYGTSECSPVVAAGATDGSTPAGNIGKPIRGVEVRLSPEGELLVRGPNVMKGYWEDPERTSQVIRDGWYHTGDLAALDQEGNIRLVGRARELIVLPSGMKVWPQDLEEVLKADPAVKDAAVVAVANSRGGMRLHAYLIPSGDRSVDPPSVLWRCNARLARHQRLTSASWWPESEFPRTALMKLKRHLLPEPGMLPAAGPVALAPVDDVVGQTIAAAAGVESVGAHQTLGDLGMDSMALVQLAIALEERTGKPIRDEDLNLELTVEQVRKLAGSAGVSPATRGRDARVPSKGPKASTAAPWPYTWGRLFRFLSFPFDLLYRVAIERTLVLGGEHLAGLSEPVLFAGTHHSFADVPLIRHSLAMTAARRFTGRLVVAAAAEGFGSAGLWAKYGILAFGLYPLRRWGAGKESLGELAALAREGNAPLVFAQGRHARPEQEQAGDRAVDFKMGAASLARELGATVVPFGLAGTEQAMPAFPEEFGGPVIAGIPVSVRRVPLAIAYGEPMKVESGETLQQFTRRLQEASYALTRQAESALGRRQPMEASCETAVSRANPAV